MQYSETVTTTTTVVQSVHSEPTMGIVDKNYIYGIPGILKYVEEVTSIIGYICVAVTIMCVSGMTTYGFFNFVTLGLCFICTLVLHALLLFKLQYRICKCQCTVKGRVLNWQVMELGYYVIVVILLFFADLFLSIQACLAGHKAGAAFGWFALVAYCVDTFFAFRRWLGRKESSEPTSTGATSPSTDAGPKY